MALLLSDPRVSAVPVRDVDEPLVVLDSGFGLATSAAAALYGLVFR